MEDFFTSNTGMGSRIAHHIDFPDFNADELLQIAHIMLREEQYTFSDDAEDAFREYLERRMEQPRFSNGRSVGNALERARLRHASRVVNERDEVGKDDLMRIEAEDILKSRVFADQDEGMATELFSRLMRLQDRVVAEVGEQTVGPCAHEHH